MRAKKCSIPSNYVDFKPFTYADCYCVEVSGEIDAETAANFALLKNPAWVDQLMRLRNFIVKPFGIATDGAKMATTTKTIGMFPIVSNVKDQIVLGFDDVHLNFRIVVDAMKINDGTKIFTTTYVKTHNLLGKTYLFMIKPFHKVIVRNAVNAIRENCH